MRPNPFHRSRARWLTIILVIALPCFAAPALAETVDGFVTQLDSPTEFDVGTLHISMNGNTQCRKATMDSNITGEIYDSFIVHHYPELDSRPDRRSIRSADCGRLRLRIGSRVGVVGDAGKGDGSISAVRVTAYAVEFQQQIDGDLGQQRKWAGAALLEEKPEVSRKGRGWAGTLWLDGYPMAITPATILLAAQRGSTGLSVGGMFARSASTAFSPARFQANTWAVYRGIGMADSPAMIYRLRLWGNLVDENEKKYWAKFAPAVVAPDYANRTPGSATFPHARATDFLSIIPDQGVQDFVSKLGASLVPEYQKALPDSDATKIRFRFYVVREAGTAWQEQAKRFEALWSPRREDWEAPFVALPDGLIFVPDGALARIVNEAQLASLLSCAITSVLQKQSYLSDSPYSGFKSGIPLFLGLDRLVLAVWNNEQALRIGMRQMYLAGYDVREAPLAWAAAMGDPPNNPIINSKTPRKDVTWYVAYAFDHIRQFYSDVDYSKLKRGEPEYRQFLGELRMTDSEAFEDAQKDPKR